MTTRNSPDGLRLDDMTQSAEPRQDFTPETDLLRHLLFCKWQLAVYVIKHLILSQYVSSF
jgi:hypothetical protein